MIKKEIKNKLNGNQAYIFIKLNNLVDTEMINALYLASQAGVDIKLIVRSMCSLVPGIPGVSENIKVISIVDKFLEHSRIFIFCNGGEERYYLSSADLMSRNLDRRVEVACPIYDKNIQLELRTFLDIQWNDNTKARSIDDKLLNSIQTAKIEKKVRAQWDFYDFLKERNSLG